MPLTKKQIALIHVARQKLDMSDNAYRTVLAKLCGKTSTTELDQDDFEVLLAFFEYSGFKPVVAGGPDYGARPGMASFAQLELIRTLWAEYTKGGPGLQAWLKRCFKIDSDRFLTAGDARKAIVALKAMKARTPTAA